MQIGQIVTFDNPESYMARWNKIIKIEGNRIWLEFQGWGWIEEIKGEKK